MSGTMLQLTAGSVFHLWCAHCSTPKWKFHVVAFIEPKLRYFLINTRPAAFQLKDTTLSEHQLEIRQVGHPFLHHDSVIDCSQIVGGPTASELEDLYAADQSMLLGRIATQSRRAVRAVASSSYLLSPKEIKAIQAIW